jgi:hypothetical protein
VVLYTFQELSCARTLYERVGFRLTEEIPAEQSGGIIVEQKFEIDL